MKLYATSIPDCLRDLNMDSTSAGLIFLLSLSLSVIHLSAEKPQAQTCISSFQCGSLGTLGYPFTPGFLPDCGPCLINCTEPHSTIQLGKRGLVYNLNYSFGNGKTFLVDDWDLIHAVNLKTCDMFNGSFSLPKSPSVMFTVLLYETMWRCPENMSCSAKGRNAAHCIHECGSFNVYDYKRYNDSQFNLLGCSRIQYPKALVVDLTDECSRCIDEGGHCQDTVNKEFKCANKKKGRRNLTELIVIGILGGSIIFIILGLVIRHIKKIKPGSPAIASSTISPDPASIDLQKSQKYFKLPLFSYTELEKATRNFDPTMELGDGGFGTVYYGKLEDGREVAVKRLHERNYKQLQQFMNEIEIITSLRHQNLVSLYGCTSCSSQELLLVYEYVPNGTIADHLYGERAKFGILTWPIRMSIAIETARALSYLHASDIIHRDVKSNNILLDNSFCVKLVDFGLSRLFPMDVTHISTIPQGTPGYLDPEYHQCYQLTDKSDVYSFGVVLVELLSSMPAININRKEVNLSNYAIKKIQSGAFDELFDQRLEFKSNQNLKKVAIAVAELAFQCLQHGKDFRPSMAEVRDTLTGIESAYHEAQLEEKDLNDTILKAHTESDRIWLLRYAEK